MEALESNEHAQLSQLPARLQVGGFELIYKNSFTDW